MSLDYRYAACLQSRLPLRGMPAKHGYPGVVGGSSAFGELRLWDEGYALAKARNSAQPCSSSRGGAPLILAIQFEQVKPIQDHLAVEPTGV